MYRFNLGYYLYCPAGTVESSSYTCVAPTSTSNTQYLVYYSDISTLYISTRYYFQCPAGTIMNGRTCRAYCPSSAPYDSYGVCASSCAYSYYNLQYSKGPNNCEPMCFLQNDISTDLFIRDAYNTDGTLKDSPSC